MELKVWVDAIQRIVCGISEQTTCQEVIYALAHATGKTGRFVLVEKWRTSERSLSPHDKPLELLFKWGEYSSDVQFVLHCLEDVNAAGAAVAVTTAKSPKFPTKFEQKPFGAESAPTPKPAPESVATPVPKPYFVDTSRPAPESGTLRPSAGAGAGAAAHYQQHARFGSELPRNLAQEQTTVLGHTAGGGAYNNGANRQHGYRRQNGANLTVLSQSAHEHLMSAPFFGANSNNGGGSCMESSFSSSTSTADLHNVSGQSSSLSSGGGSRRHPVPPSPATQIRGHNSNNFAINNNNSRIASPVRRPPPPSYEQVMNNRRNNYSNLLITPPLTAQSSRSGTPVNQPYAGIPSSGHWPAPAAMSREQLLKIVESQHALINQQENKIRGLDNLLDEEQTKIVATEKQYYERDLDKMQKELQQLEVRRVHIKQNVEELRRQDLDSHVTAARQQSVALATENRSFVEKTNNLDAQLGQKRQIVEKLQVELSRDGDLLSLPLSLLSIDQNFDQSIVDLEEKIRDRKKTIDNLEATLAKESSLERLTVSLNNLRQLQQSSTVVVEGHKSPHSLSSSASSSPLVNIMDRAKSPSVVPPLFKETTPGVWV